MKMIAHDAIRQHANPVVLLIHSHVADEFFLAFTI